MNLSEWDAGESGARRFTSGRVVFPLKIGLDFLPDDFGDFDAYLFDPALIFLEGPGMLGRVDKDLEIGADAALQFGTELHILVE